MFDCSKVVVSARGVDAAGIKPIMQLWVDGKLRAQWDVLPDTREYTYDANLCTGGHNVDIVYTNDCSTPTVDRNLYVYYIKAGGVMISSDDPSVKYDRGVGNAAFDGVDVINGQTLMEWDGALRFKINGGMPATTTTTSTTTATTTTTTMPGSCTLIGDYPPCGTVTLGEVIDLIMKWANNQANIGDVINLIEAYKTSP